MVDFGLNGDQSCTLIRILNLKLKSWKTSEIHRLLIKWLTVSGLIGGYFAPQTFVILEKPGCAICEYVINDLQAIIGSNRSEAQIEAGLEKVRVFV
jgi:hypothetical protein